MCFQLRKGNQLLLMHLEKFWVQSMLKLLNNQPRKTTGQLIAASYTQHKEKVFSKKYFHSLQRDGLCWDKCYHNATLTLPNNNSHIYTRIAAGSSPSPPAERRQQHCIHLPIIHTFLACLQQMSLLSWRQVWLQSEESIWASNHV